MDNATKLQPVNTQSTAMPVAEQGVPTSGTVTNEVHPDAFDDLSQQPGAGNIPVIHAKQAGALITAAAGGHVEVPQDNVMLEHQKAS